MAATHSTPHRMHQGVLHVTRRRTVTSNGAVASTILLLLALTMPAVAASEEQVSNLPPGQARFEGHSINLQRGWGDAHTCVVWNADGETDCFRAEQAADAAVQRRERAEARAATVQHATSTDAHGMDQQMTGEVPLATAAAVCGSWLYLYEHVGHAGRSLRFRDRGTTQDLAAWGFASQTSSYRVGACGVVLRDAGGSAYPGWTGPHASASRMLTGWNDRVRYLRIS